MRRAAKVDSNQNEIVSTFRKMGASVLITSQLKNCFDLLVGFKGVNMIVEVKDGSLPPSKRKLTPGEKLFKESWRGGEYHIINSVDEAIDLLNKV